MAPALSSNEDMSTANKARKTAIGHLPLLDLAPEIREIFYITCLEAGPKSELRVVNGLVNEGTELETPWRYKCMEPMRFYKPFELLERFMLDPKGRKDASTNAIVSDEPEIWSAPGRIGAEAKSLHLEKYILLDFTPSEGPTHENYWDPQGNVAVNMEAFHVWRIRTPAEDLARIRTVHIQASAIVSPDDKLKQRIMDIAIREREGHSIRRPEVPLGQLNMKMLSSRSADPVIPVCRVRISGQENEKLCVMTLAPLSGNDLGEATLIRVIRTWAKYLPAGHRFDGHDVLKVAAILGGVKCTRAWSFEANIENTVPHTFAMGDNTIVESFRLKAGYDPAANDPKHPQYMGYKQTVQLRHHLVTVSAPKEGEAPEYSCADPSYCVICGCAHSHRRGMCTWQADPHAGVVEEGSASFIERRRANDEWREKKGLICAKLYDSWRAFL